MIEPTSGTYGVGDAPHQTFSHQSPMHEKDGKA